MRMRDIISLVEAAHHLEQGWPLLHGTSDWGWEQIRAENRMIDDPDRPSGGICFTQSRAVAEEFVRLACGRYDCDKGVVIEIDTRKLMADFEVVSYTDPTLDKDWVLQDEHEFRVNASVIPNIKKYIVGSYTVWRNSYSGI